MTEAPDARNKEARLEQSPEGSIEKRQDEQTFPEGGARAWGVALGASGILFCTFGFANSFG